MFEYEEELERLQQQLAHYEARDDWQKIAELLGEIAIIYSNWPAEDENSEERREQAKEYYDRQLGIYKRIDDPKKVIDSLSNLGDYFYKHSYYDEAIEHFLKALEVCSLTKDLPSAGRVWGNHLAPLHLLLGDYEDAYMYANRAINVWEGAKEKLSIAFTWVTMGHILQIIGRFNESYPYLDNALNLYQNENYDIGTGIALRYLGDLYADIGELTGAFLAHSKAYAIAEYQMLIEEQLLCLIGLVQDAIWLEHIDKAEELTQKAWDLAKKYGLGHYQKHLNLLSALVKRHSGRLMEAIHYISEAQCCQIEQLPLELECTLLLDEILLLEGKTGIILATADNMMKLADILDLPRYLWNVHYIMGRCYDWYSDTSKSSKEYEQAFAYFQLALTEVPADNKQTFVEHPKRKAIFQLFKNKSK